MKIDVKNDSAIAGALLDDAGVRRRTIRCKGRGSTVFAQGGPANSVYCIVSGAVKLSIVSPTGKEAVVALLESADFFGEGCLAGQKIRTSSAVALMPTTLWRIAKTEMDRALQSQPEFSQRFLAYMLQRNIRIEEDLVNQLFNSTEKRLARTLLLLARNDENAITEGKIARLPQDTLAELVGTTRPRINHFLNKFRKQGLIEYNGGLKVNKELLVNVLARE
jgi:CRP/FNR family transcriptional regulator, cyclic AMP receptor protein